MTSKSHVCSLRSDLLSVTAHNPLSNIQETNLSVPLLVENKRISTHFCLQKRQLKWDIVELTEIIHFQHKNRGHSGKRKQVQNRQEDMALLVTHS